MLLLAPVLILIIVMALPLAMLKGLQMSTKAKVGLTGIFCCAVITVAFDILRAVETLTNGSNPGSTALWTNLESAIAVIVSCLPTFKSLIGPRKDSNPGRNASPYRQRPLVDMVSGQWSKSKAESPIIEAKSFDNSLRGSSVDDLV